MPASTSFVVEYLPCLIPRLFFVGGNPSNPLIDCVFLGVHDIGGASSENY